MNLESYIISPEDGQRIVVITAESILSVMEDMECFYGSTQDAVVQHYYELKRAASELLRAKPKQRPEQQGGGVGESEGRVGTTNQGTGKGMDVQPASEHPISKQGERVARSDKSSSLPRR